MKQFENILIEKNYVNAHGFFTLNSSPLSLQQQTEAGQAWSQLAACGPVSAAAATTSSDPFAKYSTFIEDVLPNEACVVLDAGCGYGRIAIPLLKNMINIHIIGVDASSVMLQRFAQLANSDSEDKIHERLLLLQSNINKIPFPESVFDYIYSCAVLLHNPYRDVHDIIQECYRLLKPNGKRRLL